MILGLNGDGKVGVAVFLSSRAHPNEASHGFRHYVKKTRKGSRYPKNIFCVNLYLSFPYFFLQKGFFFKFSLLTDKEKKPWILQFQPY